MKTFEKLMTSIAAASVLLVGVIALTWPFILAFIIGHFVVKWW